MPADQLGAGPARTPGRPELVPDEDSWEADNRQAIAARYGVVRPFVRLLAETLPLHAAPAGVTLLTEIRGGLPTPAAPPDQPQAVDRVGPER